MSASAARRARILLCLLAVLPACDRRVTTPGRTMLAGLVESPGMLPAAIDATTPVVMVLLHLDQGRIVHESGPIVLRHETLALERALAARRTVQPAYWAVQVLPDGTRRYWSPVDPVPKVRVSVAGEAGELAGGKVALGETIVAVRLPFFPGSTVTFVDPAGNVAGRLVFGDGPEILVVAGS